MPDEVLEGLLDGIGAGIRGRKWIVASESAVGVEPVEFLRQNGADDVLVVAAIRGVGDLPDAEIVYLDRTPTDKTVMGAIRGLAASLHAPDARSAEAIDAFDPDRSAMVVIPPFFTHQLAFGRPVHAPRRPAWSALEDKMLADEIWDAAAVPRAERALVDPADAPEAAARLDLGDGTVWVADNSTGWHGGGDYVRWLRPDADAEAMRRWFEPRADRVRVMPFLEGIPCSIHGFVTPTGVAAFRPFEMVVLRDPNDDAFVYAGGASFWDPPASDREEMRSAARRVGALLRDRVDYRGAFSIDGVMTRDGFRPTELNPRFSMGFASLAAKVEGLPPDFLMSAFVEGAIEVDHDWLESTVVAASDANRSGGMGMPVGVEPPRDPEPLHLRFTAAGADVVSEEEGQGVLRAGSGPSGTYLQLRLDPERVEIGKSVAPYAAAAVAVAGVVWDLPVPDAQPAPDVRG